MPTFIKIVATRRMILGLGLASLGVALLVFIVLSGGRVRLRLVAFALLFIAIGLALAIAALRQDACSVCRVPIERAWTALPSDARLQIEAAIQAALAGNVGAISGLGPVALPPVDYLEVASFECEYCPKCEVLSRVAAGRRRRLPDGQTTTHDFTPWVVLAGPPAKTVLALLTARNQALTKQMTLHDPRR